MIHRNVITDFSQKEYMPVVDASAYVHPLAAVIGNVTVGRRVMVSPFASIRETRASRSRWAMTPMSRTASSSTPLETEHEGHAIEANLVEVKGKKFSVHVGSASPWPTRSRSTAPLRWATTPSWACRRWSSRPGWVPAVWSNPAASSWA